jgi:hypothetical protein
MYYLLYITLLSTVLFLILDRRILSAEEHRQKFRAVGKSGGGFVTLYSTARAVRGEQREYREREKAKGERSQKIYFLFSWHSCSSHVMQPFQKCINISRSHSLKKNDFCGEGFFGVP